MALLPYCLASLAELKAFLPAAGGAKDDEFELALARASRRVEEYVDRRLIYRAPAGEASTDVIVAEVALSPSLTTLTILNQPNSAGRTVKVIITDPARSVKGTLTVTGTVAGVAGVTEVFNLASGGNLYGTKFFTGSLTAACSGITDTSTGDFLKLVACPGYTEFHHSDGGSVIQPLEWPIRQVVEVNEDTNGVFGTTTALTLTTDYVVREPSSIGRKITRVSGSLDYPFYAGYRVVKVRYSAGYFTRANVPEDIKGVVKRLAASFYNEANKGQIELASGSNALGSWSRFGPAELTVADKEALAPYLRGSFDRTCERDWDLDAA
jgi:hypothetical protein